MSPVPQVGESPLLSLTPREAGNREISQDQTTVLPSPSKALRLPKQGPKLTMRNRSFLEHLLAGKTTVEAYRLAGYTGKSDAPYQLRLRLKEELKQALEGEGFDR